MDKNIFIISIVILFFFIITNYKDLFFTTKELLFNSKVTNLRAIILISGGIIFTGLKFLELVNVSFIFNIYLYYFLFISLLCSYLVWIIKIIIRKEKFTPFSKVFINKKFCFEELVIYLLFIVIIFPFGIDLSYKKRFDFHFILKTSNNFTDKLKFSSYTNIDNKIDIANSSEKAYNLDIETYYSQFKDIIPNDDYFFCNFDTLSNGNYYFRYSLINANSQLEFDVLQAKVIIPNFISFPFNIDSTSRLFERDDYLSYLNYTQGVTINIGRAGNSYSRNGVNYYFPGLTNNNRIWRSQFVVNWVTRLSLRDDNGVKKIFLFFGTFKHLAALASSENRYYYCPGYSIDYCNMYYKFLDDKKVRQLAQECFIGRCDINKSNINPAYEYEEASIFLGDNSENIIVSQSKHNKYIYATFFYVKGQKLKDKILDIVKSDVYVNYTDSINNN